MVFYQITQLNVFFTEMKKKLLKKNQQVQIYCSYEVDSICSVKILSILFSQENIKYQIKPVMGIRDLELQLESIRNVPTIGYVIFVNCGGQIPLIKQLQNFENVKIKAVLMDSHRPINHENISHENKNLIVIDDKRLNKEKCPIQEDFDYLLEEENDENYLEFESKNDKKEDDNEENKKILENIEKQKQQYEERKNGEKSNDQEQDEEESLSEEIQDENSVSEIKEKKNGSEIIDVDSEIKSQNKKELNKEIDSRKNDKSPIEKIQIEDSEEEQEDLKVGEINLIRKKQRKNEREMIKQKIIKKIDDYYSGSYAGLSIAGILYFLCQQFNKDNNKILWYWILGLSDQRQNY